MVSELSLHMTLEVTDVRFEPLISFHGKKHRIKCREGDIEQIRRLQRHNLELVPDRKIRSGFFVGDPRGLDNLISSRCSLPHFTS